MTRDKLIQRIGHLVEKYWAETSTPFLLSALPPSLEEENIELASIIGPVRLKDFLERSSEEPSAQYKLVIDPVHNARIGLIPKQADFSYPVTTGKDPKNYNNITMEFLKLIENLPKEDADQIIIPVRILAKLLHSRS